MIQMFVLVREGSQVAAALHAAVAHASRGCASQRGRVLRILLQEIYTSLHYVNCFHRRARLLQHQTCSASLLVSKAHHFDIYVALGGRISVYCSPMKSPRRRRANCKSRGIIVTRFPWMAARLVSSNIPTMYISDAS